MRNQRVRGLQSTVNSMRRVGKVPYRTLTKQVNATRLVIIFLTMLAVLLVGLWATKDLGVAIPSETGSISGLAVDERLKPVQANVSVLKTGLATQAGVDGVFKIDRVPAGAQHVIVAYQGVGHELKVVVEAGKTVQIGTIKLVTTQMAP